MTAGLPNPSGRQTSARRDEFRTDVRAKIVRRRRRHSRGGRDETGAERREAQRFSFTGDELHELKRFTIDMAEAFGLDRRIEAYSGKRPIGFYRWDLDCLLAVMDLALKD